MPQGSYDYESAGMSKSDYMAALGNGVCVPVMKRVILKVCYSAGLISKSNLHKELYPQYGALFLPK